MEEAAAKAKEYAQKPRQGEIEIDPKKVQQAKAQVKTEEAKGFFKKALNAVKKHPIITSIVVAVPVVAAAAYGIKKVNENKQAQKVQYHNFKLYYIQKTSQIQEVFCYSY